MDRSISYTWGKCFLHWQPRGMPFLHSMIRHQFSWFFHMTPNWGSHPQQMGSRSVGDVTWIFTLSLSLLRISSEGDEAAACWLQFFSFCLTPISSFIHVDNHHAQKISSTCISSSMDLQLEQVNRCGPGAPIQGSHCRDFRTKYMHHYLHGLDDDWVEYLYIYGNAKRTPPLMSVMPSLALGCVPGATNMIADAFSIVCVDLQDGFVKQCWMLQLPFFPSDGMPDDVVDCHGVSTTACDLTFCGYFCRNMQIKSRSFLLDYILFSANSGRL